MEMEPPQPGQDYFSSRRNIQREEPEYDQEAEPVEVNRRGYNQLGNKRSNDEASPMSKRDDLGTMSLD